MRDTTRRRSAWRYLSPAVLLVTGSVLLVADSAAAQGGPVGSLCPNPNIPACGTTGMGYGATHEDGDASSNDVAARRATSAASDLCTYAALSTEMLREGFLADNTAVPMNAIFYERTCDGVTRILWYVRGSSDAADDEGLEGLVEEAFARLEPPAPQVVTAPPSGSPVLTGLPMYVAVDDVAMAPLSGEVSAGEFTVTARVVPVGLRFTPGDGVDAIACDGAGTRWSPGDRPVDGDCTHTYAHVPGHAQGAPVSGGTYELAVWVTYTASYTVAGPVLAGEYDLGELDGPTATLDVPVQARRAVRVDR